MNFQNIARALMGLGALWLTGCNSEQIAGVSSSGSDAEKTADVCVSYSLKSGLLVSPETAKFIGLEIAEVSQRRISGRQEVTARVFRTSTTNESRALASATVATTDAAELQPRLRSIDVPSFPVAEVLRIDRREADRAGTVEVILQVDDAGRTLAEGGFVTAQFAVGSTNAVTAVPSSAILRTLDGTFVYLENGAHLTRAEVKAGRTDGAFTEVTDGLLTGDRVVVRPVMTLWMTELHYVNGGDACCLKREVKP